MSFLYLGALLASLAGMVVLDWRYRLFFWRSTWHAVVVMLAGLAVFVVWDVAGIALGLFTRGESSIMTGVLLGHEFPLEEIFFLAFLCYLTMNLFAVFERLLAARRADR